MKSSLFTNLLRSTLIQRQDERNDSPPKNYPFQDHVDPLSSRFPLYVNAKDCAVEWIAESARRASNSGKAALFFMLHASFYQENGVRAWPAGRSGPIIMQRT